MDPDRTTCDRCGHDCARRLPLRDVEYCEACTALQRDELLEAAARILRAFYCAPISIATLQPVLALAVELNPDLRDGGTA